MISYIEERVIEVASYVIEKNATIRQTAKTFGVSKSTIHKDLVERLPQISLTLSLKANEILMNNKKERNLRGGNSTKIKYQKMKEGK